MSIKFVPPRVPLVEAGTNLIAREWYRFFADFFTATQTVTTPDDFGVQPDAGADVLAALYQLGVDTGQQLGNSDLAARVAVLERAIDSLRSGQAVL